MPRAKPKLVLEGNRSSRLESLRSLVVSEEPPKKVGKEMVVAPVMAKEGEKRVAVLKCQRETKFDRQCSKSVIPGTLYCWQHQKGEETHGPQHELLQRDYPLFNYGVTLDVLNSYTEKMSEEDRKFILSVYGDASLDSEIALLRLVIRNLISEGSSGQKFQHLPRLVTALSDAFREAVRMVEGNKLTVEFTTRNGQEYWRELFQTFAQLLEDGLATRLCPDCRETVQRFIQGGVSGETLEDNGVIITDIQNG